jgi:hypothetical protein
MTNWPQNDDAFVGLNTTRLTENLNEFLRDTFMVGHEFANVHHFNSMLVFREQSEYAVPFAVSDVTCFVDATLSVQRVNPYIIGGLTLAIRTMLTEMAELDASFDSLKYWCKSAADESFTAMAGDIETFLNKPSHTLKSALMTDHAGAQYGLPPVATAAYQHGTVVMYNAIEKLGLFNIDTIENTQLKCDILALPYICWEKTKVLPEISQFGDVIEDVFVHIADQSDIAASVQFMHERSDDPPIEELLAMFNELQ